MITVIKNCFPVFEDKTSGELTSILIKDGKIADVDFKGMPPENAEIIDAKGGYCLPGFIDLHVHGGGGSDFMDCTLEAFKTATDTHFEHGTTTLVPTSMTASKEDLCDFLQVYKDFKQSGVSKVNLVGVHFEGPYFSGADPKSRGAQKGNLLRHPDFEEISEILEVADGSILRWDAAPELPNADKFAEIMLKNGILPAVAHTNATGKEAVLGFKNGFSHVTHFYNAVTQYRKVDQTVLAGVVEAAYLNDNVTLELIGDGCHVPKECLQLALKIKGAEKVSAITDGMRLAGTDMKSGKLGSLKNGTEVITDNGVAKLPDLSSFAGSIATMDRCLRVLYFDYEIPLNITSVMLSGAPARRLGIFDTVGSIAVGKTADLIIANKNLELQKVIKGI